jgi:hypothetical protein
MIMSILRTQPRNALEKRRIIMAINTDLEEMQKRIAEYVKQGFVEVDRKTAEKAIREFVQAHPDAITSDPPKRKRGRPRIHPIQTVKRPRGRPRKNTMNETTCNTMNVKTGWEPCKGDLERAQCTRAQGYVDRPPKDSFRWRKRICERCNSEQISDVYIGNIAKFVCGDCGDIDIEYTGKANT